MAEDNFLELPATNSGEPDQSHGSAMSTYLNTTASVEIEKECIQLYFANLHVIYYILDQSSFIRRCENEIWSATQRGVTSVQLDRKRSRFLALYHAVVAVGVLTAGDDTSVLQSCYHISSFLDRSRGGLSEGSMYPPLELAKTYFEKAKTLLGDVFESSSLETTQTLFLMVGTVFQPLQRPSSRS
jgi:hypothetical protein